MMTIHYESEMSTMSETLMTTRPIVCADDHFHQIAPMTAKTIGID